MRYTLSHREAQYGGTTKHSLLRHALCSSEFDMIKGFLFRNEVVRSLENHRATGRPIKVNRALEGGAGNVGLTREMN